MLCRLTHHEHRLIRQVFATRLQLVQREASVSRYADLVTRLGHHPTDTEVQQEDIVLSRPIRRYWGSITAFRKEQHITPPTKMSRLREQTIIRLAELRCEIEKRGVASAMDVTPPITSWSVWTRRLQVSPTPLKRCLRSYHEVIVVHMALERLKELRRRQAKEQEAA